MEMIECSQVYHSYFNGAGEVVVLQGLDLTVRRSEHVAIVGPSGAGKSTLLRLCAALDLPRDGEVFIEGVSTQKLNGKELAKFRRERVGLVFQQFSLLPALSAVENVMLPLLPYCSRHVLRKWAMSLLAEVGLGGRMEHYPDQLSGGEQQRVAIARALVASPPLLLADEPTGSLDSATGKQVMKLLDTLCQEHGCTLVVVTHDANIAAMAVRTLHMIDGCLEVASTIRTQAEQEEIGRVSH
ncbi:MAG TPA: ABC transporter ATP-binding protein [Ktedonobacteraceae bacterium]